MYAERLLLNDEPADNKYTAQEYIYLDPEIQSPWPLLLAFTRELYFKHLQRENRNEHDFSKGLDVAKIN